MLSRSSISSVPTCRPSRCRWNAHGRVDVAGAGAHDQALQRGQPHRGVDATCRRATAAGRRPVAQVQDDRGSASSSGPAQERRGLRARRTRARCRGSRSGGSGARAASSPVDRVGVRRRRAGSGGTRCRRPRPAARPGSACRRRLGCPAGSPGCAAARAATSSRRSRPIDRVVDHASGSVNVVAAVHHPVADRGELAAVDASGPCSANVAHERRTPAAWSGSARRRRTVDAVPVGPVADAPPAAPRRSARPGRTPARSPMSASSSWYLSDDEPALRTRTSAPLMRLAAATCWAWIAVIATVLTMSRDERAAGQVVDRLVAAPAAPGRSRPRRPSAARPCRCCCRC